MSRVWECRLPWCVGKSYLQHVKSKMLFIKAKRKKGTMNRYNSHLSSILFTMDFFSYNFCLLFLPRLNNERLLGLLATGASKSIVVDSTQLVIFDSLDSFLVAQLPEFVTGGSG